MSPERARANSKPSGFTLIELLVVVFIISLLVAATLVVVPKVKRAVYGAETQAQLATLANAIQQYYNDYKSYPGPLGNNQLCAGYESPPTNTPWASAASVPNSQLTAINPTNPPFVDMNYNPNQVTPFLPNNITGAQNLVLGLLGGLEMIQTPAGSGTYQFAYNPQDIFSDGVTPAPRGPASLNISSPRRQQAYIQVKAGDISVPYATYNNNTGASFADEAMRSPGDQVNNLVKSDAMIPVFLDKYSNPLPILYYRTNVGATAVVGFRNNSTLNGTQLQDGNPATGTSFNVTPQYDLLQNLPYVESKIGTNGNNSNSFHGLIGITDTANSSQLLIHQPTGSTDNPPIDPIDALINSSTPVPTGKGANGLAYFKDPSLNSTTYDGTTSNTHQGTARQKDGFLLISAGPDRLYGTHDDNVNPGPLQP